MNSQALGIQIGCDRFRISGRDRANFLHNFCTANIKGLSPWDASEAFVLNEKGKTICWIEVLARPDWIGVLTATGSAEPLIKHLDRYLMREDVKFQAASDSVLDFFFWGEGVVEKFRDATGVSLQNQKSSPAVLNNHEVIATPISMIGPGILVEVESQSLSDPEAWFAGTGFDEGTGEQLVVHRIRHRCPKWGQDFNEDYLPQELLRDDLAISFSKGCYLGQETVARLDALGHVNRMLAVVEIVGGPWLVTPHDVFAGEQKVGQITTAIEDASRPNVQLSLATLKRIFAKVGTSLRIGDATATVVEPLAPTL